MQLLYRFYSTNYIPIIDGEFNGKDNVGASKKLENITNEATAISVV